MRWIAAIALALVLTACGGGGSDDSQCYNRSNSGGVNVVTPCN